MEWIGESWLFPDCFKALYKSRNLLFVIHYLHLEIIVNIVQQSRQNITWLSFQYLSPAHAFYYSERIKLNPLKQGCLHTFVVFQMSFCMFSSVVLLWASRCCVTHPATCFWCHTLVARNSKHWTSSVKLLSHLAQCNRTIANVIEATVWCEDLINNNDLIIVSVKDC